MSDHELPPLWEMACDPVAPPARKPGAEALDAMLTGLYARYRAGQLSTPPTDQAGMDAYQPTGHAMFDEAMRATGNRVFATWLVTNFPWGGVDLRAAFREWDARTALADAMEDYAEDAQFRGPLCRVWLDAGLPPLSGLGSDCAHQSCSRIAFTHECPREQFLDDPITRSSGVGAEMVNLISCRICDALGRW
jgi:hypothetical protein